METVPFRERLVDIVSSTIAATGLAWALNEIVRSQTGYYMIWDHVWIIYLITCYGTLRHK